MLIFYDKLIFFLENSLIVYNKIGFLFLKTDSTNTSIPNPKSHLAI